MTLRELGAALARRLVREPKRPWLSDACHPTGTRWFVDKWSFYAHTLHAVGWVYRPNSGPRRVSLIQLSTGEELRDSDLLFSGIRLPSEDVESVFGKTARDCRFELIARVVAPEDARGLGLFVEFEDGEQLVLADPTCAKLSSDPYHATRAQFFEAIARSGAKRIVEIGARARSGNTIRHLLGPDVDYVGVDICPGPNVDVVCDAHELSKSVAPASVDAVLSVSVFEHLLMPWKVALEINKILRDGGLTLVMTHQGFPLHDEPWDYWRFSSQAWHALFNRFSGFEILHSAMGESGEMVADMLTPITSGFSRAHAYVGSAVIARKISNSTLCWPADAGKVVTSAYPK